MLISEIKELFLRNVDIQENIIYEYRRNEKELSANINENKLNIRIDSDRKELEKDKIKNIEELEKNRSKLEVYNSNFNKINRVFENPRSYESIPNLYLDCKQRLIDSYNLKEHEIKKYENILLRIAFYKEIYGDKSVVKGNLEEESPLTYKLLYDTVKNDLEKSIISSIVNFSKDEIVKARNMIENDNPCKVNIEFIVENFQKYYETFYSLKGLDSLLNFFNINRNYIENSLINESKNEDLYNRIFYSLDFMGLVHIDRICYTINNYSIFAKSYQHIYQLKTNTGIHTNKLERAIRVLSDEVLKKICNPKVKYGEGQDYKNFNGIKQYFSDSTNKDLNIIEIIEEFKNRNTEINQIQKKYIDYFLNIMKIYYSESKEKSIKELKEKIFSTHEKIKENGKYRSELSMTLEDIKENEKLEKEYKSLKGDLKQQLKDILSPLYFLLETIEDLKWRIELWKELDAKGIKYYEFDRYENNGKKLSDYYKEFKNKGFTDDDFEAILKKENIILPKKLNFSVNKD